MTIFLVLDIYEKLRSFKSYMRFGAIANSARRKGLLGERVKNEYKNLPLLLNLRLDVLIYFAKRSVILSLCSKLLSKQFPCLLDI